MSERYDLVIYVDLGDYDKYTVHCKNGKFMLIEQGIMTWELRDDGIYHNDWFKRSISEELAEKIINGAWEVYNKYKDCNKCKDKQQIIDKMQKKINKLENALKYHPGGLEYQHAKEDFNNLINQK